MKNNKIKTICVGDVCTLITSGGTPKSTEKNYYENGNIPWLNTQEVNFNKIYETKKFITNLGFDNSAAKWIPSKSVIVAMYGATAGKVAINMLPLTTNQACCNLVINHKVTDYRYIFYYLMLNYTKLASLSNGGAQQNLNSQVIRDFPLLLPPLTTQRQIAKILSSLDDKIELNNRINKNLEEQAMAIYKSWFVDFEPFGGKMPKDWEYIKLQQIADFISGYSYKGKELVKSKSAMATIKNFDRGGGFKMDGYKEITPSNKLKDEQFAKVFDILVAHTDLTQNADIIGNTEMIMSDLNYKKIIFSMDIVKVLPQKNIPHFVLASILKSENFKKHCLGYINGTTVLHLSKKALPDYELPFPKDIKKLSNIENLLKKHYLQIANNINENYKLNQIRDVLLPKLMNGEIDTSKIKI